MVGPRAIRTLAVGRAAGAGFALAALLCLAAVPAPAQDARVTATADTNTILVGDQVRVTVSVEHPAGTVVANLGPADTLEGLEIVRVDSVAGPGPGGTGPLTRVYTVTAFDTGTWVVPPFTAWYGPASGPAALSVTGHPVVIVVRGVDVDTSAEIRAIKPPLDAPVTLAELLPWIAAVALAALLGWLVYYILKKRKRGEKLIPQAPPRPPDELALEALRSIGAERLWQRGLVKEYHSALSDVLRTYVERRWAMPAMESTSGEILSSPAVRALAADAVSALRDVLTKADLVKFAKFIPPPEQNEKSLAESVAFVELTRKAQPAAADAEPAPAGDPVEALAGTAAGGARGQAVETERPDNQQGGTAR